MFTPLPTMGVPSSESSEIANAHWRFHSPQGAAFRENSGA